MSPVAAGGVSLARSGIVPVGRGFPQKKVGDSDDIEPGMVNLQLMASMPSSSGGGDSYGAFCASRPDKLGEHRWRRWVWLLSWAEELVENKRV